MKYMYIGLLFSLVLLSGCGTKEPPSTPMLPLHESLSDRSENTPEKEMTEEQDSSGKIPNVPSGPGETLPTPPSSEEIGGAFLPDDTAEAMPEEHSLGRLDVESVVFGGFDSPEYYQQISQMALDLQLQMAIDEASETGSVDACQKISRTNLQVQCRSQVLFSIAQDTKDPEKCAQIEDKNRQRECSSQISFAQAMEEKDLSKCDIIGDEASQKRCISFVTVAKAIEEKNPDICNTLSDQDKEMCVMESRDMIRMEEEMKKMQEEMAIPVSTSDPVDSIDNIQEEDAPDSTQDSSAEKDSVSDSKAPVDSL